jgi:hypothetical protein
MENYPDDSCAELKGAISSRYGVPVANIMVGAGSAELIRLFPEVFVRPGDKVVMPRPTFSEYGFACRLMGAELVDLPLPEDDAFRRHRQHDVAYAPRDQGGVHQQTNNPTPDALQEESWSCRRARRRDIMVSRTDLLELSERTGLTSARGRNNETFLIRRHQVLRHPVSCGIRVLPQEVIRYMEPPLTGTWGHCSSGWPQG